MITTNYIQFFFEGVMLGFATGLSCSIFCIPIIIGLSSRNINNISTVSDMSFFLVGKFIAYIFTGIFFSIIGSHLKFTIIAKIISNFTISVLLIYWGIKGFIASDDEKKNCTFKKFSKTIPFTAGVLTGISPCPPFIAGITRVVDIGDVFAGIIYFLGFYITTSLYILPGSATFFIKYKKELKALTASLAVIFGFIYMLFGLSVIFS